MKKLGYNYRLHDLRHTTASWMAMKGIPIQFIKELLGHNSVNVTEIYTHLRTDVLKKIMEEVFKGINYEGQDAGNFQENPSKLL